MYSSAVQGSRPAGEIHSVNNLHDTVSVISDTVIVLPDTVFDDWLDVPAGLPPDEITRSSNIKGNGNAR